jgi:ligand-binding SRPBCC domain-containing protein
VARVAHLQIQTQIAAPVEVVFDLSRSIDSHLNSMARSRERAIASVTSGLIELGEQVTWRAVHFGFRFTMTSKIVEMTPPSRFVDQQVRGPFRMFRHEHLFSACDDGTKMTDDISFTAPLGPIGQLVDRLALGRYMERLIVQRNGHLKAVAERG